MQRLRSPGLEVDGVASPQKRPKPLHDISRERKANDIGIQQGVPGRAGSGRSRVTLEDQFNAAVGQRVRHVRRAAKVSQRELADRVNVHANWISRCERGAGMPSILLLERISVALNVPLRALVPRTQLMEK
jgi:ribosome-binding protein aMBF1 (putative translation factor)